MKQNKTIMSLLMPILFLAGYAIDASETQGQTFVAGNVAPNAPPELGHLKLIIGQWSTREESLKQDGSGWQPSKGADWDFFWAFDGWGIQDNYTSPPKSEHLDDESKRQRGTNLRVYNTGEEKWVLTWLTPNSTAPQNFTATTTLNSMIMLSDEPDARGNHHRITFFDIQEQSFEWKLEWSQDQKKWTEVYRIHGTKKKPNPS
jgi:hypothetical protein